MPAHVHARAQRNSARSVPYRGCRRQGNTAEFSWVMKRAVLVSHALLDRVRLHEFQHPDYSAEEGLVELSRIEAAVLRCRITATLVIHRQMLTTIF